jgi:hypothetical protein
LVIVVVLENVGHGRDARVVEHRETVGRSEGVCMEEGCSVAFVVRVIGVRHCH